MGRWWFAAFLVVATLSVLTEGKGGSKYSKEKNNLKEETQLRQSANQETRKSSGHFRVARLDAVWERAQRHLNVDDQRDIFEELQDLDQDEITLKRVRHDGGDKDGKISEKLREKLREILERYDLLSPLHDASPKSATAKPKKGPKTDTATMELLFSDKRLNKLWGKAKKAGFSETELNALKVEFDEHQRKLDEYREMDANTEQEFVESNRFQDLADELSHEERLDETEGARGRVPKNILKVDEGVKNIVKNYGLLKAKVNKNAFVPENGDFKEVKVENLWKQALQAGFDRDELLSLREELVHFERKMDKLKNFREGPISGKGQGGVPLKGGERSEDFVDLEEKVKNYATKVENVHADLERRINNRHNEL